MRVEGCIAQPSTACGDVFNLRSGVSAARFRFRPKPVVRGPEARSRHAGSGRSGYAFLRDIQCRLRIRSPLARFHDSIKAPDHPGPPGSRAARAPSTESLGRSPFSPHRGGGPSQTSVLKMVSGSKSVGTTNRTSNDFWRETLCPVPKPEKTRLPPPAPPVRKCPLRVRRAPCRIHDFGVTTA